MTPIPNWKSYRRLGVYLRPYVGRLCFVILISLGSTALGLAQPYISKLLIDKALLEKDFHALLVISGMMFGAVVLGFALNILSSYRYVKLSAAMLFDMRLALFRHLQTLSPRFYATFRTGDLMSRLNNDVGEVQRVTADTLLSVLSNVVFLIGSIAMMLWLSWKLFFVSVLLLPLSTILFLRYQNRLTLLTKTLRERAAGLGSFIVDSILGMRAIVSLNAEEHEAKRFKERNDGFIETMLSVQLASFLSGALPGTILSAATALVFLYGGYEVFEGTITVGTLVAFMAYHTRLLSPLQNLMSLTAGLASARVSLGRIFELFDTPAEVQPPTSPLPIAAQPHTITLDRVCLTHGRNPILTDISLTIPAGSFCALLGPSGVGKSTLADLLVRFLDADSGTVYIDGVDIRRIPLSTLRHEILLVEQSPYLFNATIAENILYANPSASREAMAEAARNAGLEHFISTLPDGYDTQTGERGLSLSVGERQRITLARALLRNPSVLILDEPTSALDTDTEQLIAVNLRRVMQGRTLIVITHRPALAALADFTVTLRDGKLETT